MVSPSKLYKSEISSCASAPSRFFDASSAKQAVFQAIFLVIGPRLREQQAKNEDQPGAKHYLEDGWQQKLMSRSMKFQTGLPLQKHNSPPCVCLGIYTWWSAEVEESDRKACGRDEEDGAKDLHLGQGQVLDQCFFCPFKHLGW